MHRNFETENSHRMSSPKVQILLISSLLSKTKCEHFIDPGFNETHIRERNSSRSVACAHTQYGPKSIVR